MTDLERIMLARADEQCAAERIAGYRERDSWDLANDPGPDDAPKRKQCIACHRAARTNGYCRGHWYRVQAGIPVDEAWSRRGGHQ